MIEVEVPADARIFVNDNLTKTPGTYRRFVSRGLDEERVYTYNVRAEFERDGEQVEETKSLQLTSGGVARLSFAADQRATVATEPATTKLIVHVPSDAKVALSGTMTRQTGETREFSTTQLTKGQVWSDYIVKVEYTRNGQVEVQERTIELTGGQDQELTFDFDASQLAQAD